MNTLFLFLLLLSLIGLIVGLIRPRWIRFASRRQVGIVLGLSVIVFFVLFGMTAPKVAPQAPAVARSAQSSTTSRTPTTSAPSAPQAQAGPASQCAAAAASTFEKVEADYARAYQDGKDALGTTQYSDANVGLQAMTVPGSVASMFSNWQKVWRSYEPNFYNSIVQSYTAASNCYSTAGVNEPDALANWRDDMAQLDGDIGAWIPDAVGWQIQDTSTAKLTSDEATIASDFSTVHEDIANIGK